MHAQGSLSDEDRTPLGIRTIRFKADAAFHSMAGPQLQNVCIHHDVGALGAASFEAALERRLEAMNAGLERGHGGHPGLSQIF